MIDRDIDKISPFCVCKTYEGFVDEFFPIQMCSIYIDIKKIFPDEGVRNDMKDYLGEGETKEIMLNSGSYPDYKELRYVHFDVHGDKLSK